MMEKKVKLIIEVDEELYNKCLKIKDFTVAQAAIAIGNGIPITDDIISRKDLKEQAKNLLDLAVKRVEDTPTNSPCYRMYVAQENERARFVDLIDNAPPLKIETK